MAKANYDEALRRARYLEMKLSRTTTILNTIGSVLLFAGRFQEAEEILREGVIELLKSGAFSRHIVINYGYALLRLRHYESAGRIFEWIMKISPKEGHAYAGMAAVYLDQHEPERALTTLELILKQQKRSPRGSDQRHLVSSLLADEAWALAMQSHYAEAERSLAQASGLMDKKFKPGLADFYFKAGKVMALKHDRKHAVAYFNNAKDADPLGFFGQLSDQALQEIISKSTD